MEIAADTHAVFHIAIAPAHQLQQQRLLHICRYDALRSCVLRAHAPKPAIRTSSFPHVHTHVSIFGLCGARCLYCFSDIRVLFILCFLARETTYSLLSDGRSPATCFTNASTHMNRRGLFSCGDRRDEAQLGELKLLGFHFSTP